MKSSPNTDELIAILNGCKKNDRKSQELLYKQFYGFGMSICMRYTRTSEEAIEVLNDGYMKAYTKLDSFDIERPFSSWIKRIFVNTAIDHYRSQQKYYNHKDIDEVYNRASSESNAEDKLKYDDLLKLIHTLPPHYQMNFNLFAIEGYSHEQISKIMDVSVGTSKSNVSRARIMLRSIMEKKEILK